WSGEVHYPYFEHQSFSIDLEGKFYFNFFYLLDFFLGSGFSFLPYNRVYVDISSDVNIKAVDRNDNEIESHDGGLILKGTAKGRWFIPRIMVGMQLNLGAVQLPIQLAWTLSEEVKKVLCISSGITLSF
ncbi:MAG: hypothetical protein ACE5QV_06505, partial [Fidelibacterota bacterium]